MPIYEFHCDKCEQDSEMLVRSSKWKGTKCPHCGSARLSKKLSVFASSEWGQPVQREAVMQRRRVVRPRFLRWRRLLRRREASALKLP